MGPIARHISILSLFVLFSCIILLYSQNVSGKLTGIGVFSLGAKQDLPVEITHTKSQTTSDARVDAGSSIRVYRYDGTTLLGMLVHVSADSIVYSTIGTGTVITAGPADRSSGYGGEGWHYSYYTTANCTGTIYGDYNYYYGAFQGGRTFAYTDGDYYYYVYDYTGAAGMTYNSYWNGTSCVASTNFAYLSVVTAVNRKICGAGDCKIK